ncbi:MAG TPA: caspase family protein [Flavobacteriales bacterium]|nr:caspase family protein [Flavobacteriales bacterium]
MSTPNKPAKPNPVMGYALGALLMGGGVYLLTRGFSIGWGLVACALLFLPFVWSGVRNAIPMRELGAIRSIITLGIVVLGALPFIKGAGPGQDKGLTRGGGPPPDMNVLDSASDPAKGRYVALLFAAEAYKHWQPLDRPIDDANALKALLTTRYTFTENDVKLITDPTREDIISALDELSTSLGPNDNLLIYYAGHGAVRKAGKQGSWIPVDGETGNKSSKWVSSDDIVTRLNGLAAKHILVLVDACFGGTILSEIGGTRGGELDPTAVKQIYNKRSRKAMTSGAAEEVSDASPFMQLIRAELGNNQQQVLLATQLFSSVQDSLVRMDYAQAPQFSNILTDGNDGGDFVFVRKDR